MTESRQSNTVELRPRTPQERMAYCQGYRAGLTYAEQFPGNVGLMKEAMVKLEREAAAEVE